LTPPLCSTLFPYTTLFRSSLPALAFGAIWAVGLCIDQSARTEFPLWMLLAVFGSMWVVLGASTSLAYFVQWRLRKRLASSTVERSEEHTSELQSRENLVCR